MALAKVSDVEVRLGRTFNDDAESSESTYATALLEDAELIILTRVPDLLTREDLQRVAVMVEANAVVRVLKNPDSYVSESDGNYTYRRPEDTELGRLHILADEWRLLRADGGGMFVLQPDFTPWQGLV